MTARVLFILKNSSEYGYSGYGNKKSSGLRNSAHFVSQMLNDAGIESKVVIVTDNNDIDREVTQYRPTHVCIEALWVVPEKFNVLVALHPSVKWIIRIHSEIPFLALEGIAIEWLKAYAQLPNVFVSSNSWRGVEDLETIVGQDVLFLPNYYPIDFNKFSSFDGDVLNVGCFGAIRPFKSQLLQAVAAIDFARENDLDLNFHINATRIEDGGPVLKNLRALFEGNDSANLIEHNWLNHHHFLDVVRQMDLCMSVSLTETFSIVTADAVAQGVPIVTSPEVSWTSPKSQAGPTDTDDIVATMTEAFENKSLVKKNQKLLAKYSAESRKVWLTYLGIKESLCSTLFSW